MAYWSKWVDHAAEVEQAAVDGFNGVSLTLEWVMEEDEAAWRRKKELFDKHRFSSVTCLSALPYGIVVTEQGFNLYYWMEYLKKALRRFSALGCRHVIWGDGGARMLPLEDGREEMKGQALQFVYLLCQLCENYGITVLIEPLSLRATNYLNSKNEVGEFIAAIKKNNVGVALTLHEVVAMDSSLSHVADNVCGVQHVFWDNPLAAQSKSLSPSRADQYDYRPFLRALRNNRYGGVITLPANAGAQSLRYCRESFASG